MQRRLLPLILLLSALAMVGCPRNRPPIADAGRAQTILAGGYADLDGSRSADPDGDVLRYAWSCIGKPEGCPYATVEDPTRERTRSCCLDPGVYVFQLTVSDGLLSDSATVQVTTTEEEDLGSITVTVD